jgi:tripartite-type tricarboxylate transporter receptor subunit TctC
LVSAAAKIVFELKRQQKRRIEVGAAVLAVNVSLYRRLPFDPVKDFVNVSLTVATPNILAVHPAVPAKSVRALIQLARAKPRRPQLCFCGKRHDVAPRCRIVQNHG